jgi:hypothetical protein
MRLALLLLLVLAGCTHQLTFDQQLARLDIPVNYAVAHSGSYASSGGGQSWDLRYVVRNETVVSCEGNLTSGRTGIARPCATENLSSETFYFTMGGLAAQLQDKNLTRINETNCFGNDIMKTCFENNTIVYHELRGRATTFWNVSSIAK